MRESQFWDISKCQCDLYKFLIFFASKAKTAIVDFRSFQGEKCVNTSHWTNLFRPFFL